MKELPFSVDNQLAGWDLFWCYLSIIGPASPGLGDLRATVAETVRQRFNQPGDVAAYPAVAAMRRLFRAAGCDPTRYRPAAEALLRRLTKGGEIPAIHPLVDVNNCLSAELAVPCCVMAEGSFGDSLTFRVGQPGESYLSLRGPFKLAGKPLLVDQDGPLDTPITGNKRVMVVAETSGAWLVAYLPAGEVSGEQASAKLESYQEAAGIRAEPA